MDDPRARLIAVLRSFPGDDKGDLAKLDEVISAAVATPQDDALDDALLGIFERFPGQDGNGVYWSIIHGLEGRGDYEPRLLASIRRAPSDFTVLMLNRMCNAGIDTCAGVSNLALLAEVASSTTAPMSARQEADRYLAMQRKKRDA